jgi:hypothetical protein
LNKQNILIVILTLITGFFALSYFSEDREVFRMNRLKFEHKIDNEIEKFDRQFDESLKDFSNEKNISNSSLDSILQSFEDEKSKMKIEFDRRMEIKS